MDKLRMLMHLLLVFVLFYRVDCNMQLTGWLADKLYDDVIPTSGGYTTNVTSPNAMQCARVCNRDADCSAFVYVSNTLTCQLYNSTWDNNETMTSAVSAEFYGLAYRYTCPSGWETFRGSCYFFGTTGTVYTIAKSLCESHGGHLVHVDDETENTFIKQRCKSVLELGGTSVISCWIGLTDSTVEGEWRWVDDQELLTYTDWESSNPNEGTSANCASLYQPYNFLWVDEPCWYVYVPICEKVL